MASKTGETGAGAEGAAGDVPSGADKTISAVLGEIVWLMSQSAEFKQYLISDLEWLVMPPILLRQFRLFYHEGRPAGVVLYGKVSDDVAARLDAGAPTLRPADWRSGDTMKVVKVIAPFGGGEKFAEQAVSIV